VNRKVVSSLYDGLGHRLPVVQNRPALEPILDNSSILQDPVFFMPALATLLVLPRARVATAAGGRTRVTADLPTRPNPIQMPVYRSDIVSGTNFLYAQDPESSFRPGANKSQRVHFAQEAPGPGLP